MDIYLLFIKNGIIYLFIYNNIFSYYFLVALQKGMDYHACKSEEAAHNSRSIARPVHELGDLGAQVIH